MKALLVEDEGFTREGLKLLISDVMPEMEVTAVGSLADATKALDEHLFAFIFLDIELHEERSGLDFLDILKDRDLEARVIMLSNQDDQETVLEAVRRGAFGFLPKQTEERRAIRHAIEVVLKGGFIYPSRFTLARGCALPQSGHLRSLR